MCCVTQGMVGIIYTSLLMSKINEIEFMNSFQSVKDMLPEHKPFFCISSYTQHIFRCFFINVVAYFSPNINRPMYEGFVFYMNGI